MMMKKKNIGRPRKKGERFTERFPIMLTPTQYELIQGVADSKNKYMGEWARMILVSEAKKVKGD